MTRHIRNRVLALCAVTLSGTLACGGNPSAESGMGTSTAKLSASATPIAVVVYSPRGALDDSNFTPFPPPSALGGRVLEGNPQLSGRIDLNDGIKAAGLFKATTGKIEVTFPFTEHATVLEGEVTITDATGQSHTYKPGDSYLIRQGQVVIWDVKGKYVIKSFFNVVETSQ